MFSGKEMTDRPTIVSEVVAEIVGAAPARVGKRLDRNPAAAKDWAWVKQTDRWKVTAGEETVTLVVDLRDRVANVGAASCTCLLAPKCFHILACVTSLAYAQHGEDESKSDTDQTEPAGALPSEAIESGKEVSGVEMTDSMCRAARISFEVVESVLIAGARASGLVIQSSLLRAAHQCRAEGLVNLSNAVIRLAEGIQRLRAGDDHADSDQIRKDAVGVIRFARALLHNSHLNADAVGYIRRPYRPVPLSRLRGILAEPILTLSGYAGICVHLQGDDGRLYQIVDLRPGDASLVRQAYHGGIDVGSATISASTLGRCCVDVQNLTVSPDGRLGKGTKTRWAVRSGARSDEFSGHDVSERFDQPLAQQVTDVFDRLASDTSESGWDLVACQGTVMGPRGAVILLEVDGFAEPIELGISIDSDALMFRRNLQLLARCPGLKVRVYGRLRMDSAGRIDALSIEPIPVERNCSGDTNEKSDFDSSPRLVLPDELSGRCLLGVDELQRHHVTQANRFAKDVDATHPLSTDVTRVPTLFPGLESRLTIMVVGGRGVIAAIGSATHRRDYQRLLGRTQTSAAQLLEALAIASSSATDLAVSLAAADHYCETARTHHQLGCWRDLMIQS